MTELKFTLDLKIERYQQSTLTYSLNSFPETEIMPVRKITVIGSKIYNIHIILLFLVEIMVRSIMHCSFVQAHLLQ